MSATSAVLLPPPIPAANDGTPFLASRFRLVRLLGRGGMGEVWEAWDEDLGRKVAIKLLQRWLADHPEFARRFKREMRILANLPHPGIPQVYSTGTAPDGRLYMVMQLVPGVNLREYMRGRPEGHLDAVSACCVAIRVAEALAVAHAAEIRHQDIKPENIIVAREGEAWLLDFGIAGGDGRAVLEAAGEAAGANDLSGRLGTIGYISPEQAERSPVDHRADLYGLGVTLYEMLAGRLPYDVSRTDRSGMLAAHAFHQPVPLATVAPRCPDLMVAIVHRLLEKHPDDRYASADELLADLRVLFRESAPPNHPMAPAIAQDRRDQERKRAFARRPSAPSSSPPPEGELPGSMRPASLPPESMPPPVMSRTEPMPAAPAVTEPPATVPEATPSPGARITLPLGPEHIAQSPAHPAARAARVAAGEPGADRVRQTTKLSRAETVKSPAHPDAGKAAHQVAPSGAPLGRRSPVLLGAAVVVGVMLVGMLLVGLDVGVRLGQRPATGVAAAPSVAPPAGPTMTAEPAMTAEPTVTAEPAMTAEPTVTAEPAVTAEPTAAAEPTATGVPTATAEPAATAVAMAGPSATAMAAPGPTTAPAATMTASAAPPRPRARPATLPAPRGLDAKPAPHKAPEPPRTKGRLFGDDNERPVF